MFEDIIEKEIEVTDKEVIARLPLIPKKRDRESLEKMIKWMRELIREEKRKGLQK